MSDPTRPADLPRPDRPGSAAARPADKPLRVLVVEDSLTIRKYLVALLEANHLEVIGEASDGAKAFELCRSLAPDVVTMDMILPIESGLSATEQIMAYCPTPILIVSASVNRGEMFETYEALSAGAVDVFDKVRAGEVSAEWERRFVAAVRMVARIRVITHPRARLKASQTALAEKLEPHSLPSPVAQLGSGLQADLIAIGASTGGPAAIAEILRGLPAGFPIPLVIVLHISELFSFAFAEWLNTLSATPAHYAADGEALPQPGRPQIILAPAGKHLIVEGERFRLGDGPERNSCRPSIDNLFESLARNSRRTVFCLLTGMGRDGATGMLAARQAGHETIAQDETSSVIFGMPAEAIRLGGVNRVLSIQEIAPTLTALASLPSGFGRRRLSGTRNEL